MLPAIPLLVKILAGLGIGALGGQMGYEALIDNEWIGEEVEDTSPLGNKRKRWSKESGETRSRYAQEDAAENLILRKEKMAAEELKKAKDEKFLEDAMRMVMARSANRDATNAQINQRYAEALDAQKDINLQAAMAPLATVEQLQAKYGW